MSNKPRYKAYLGKGIPIKDKVPLEVIYRDGVTCKGIMFDWEWEWGTEDNPSCNIIAYKVLEE